MKTMLILGVMFAAIACSADPGVVVLRDGTELDDAVIVRLNQAHYIVQTADALYELSGDELDPDTLRDRNFSSDRPPVDTRHFAELHADGTGTRYWTGPVENDGRKAMTELRMGLAFWERAVAHRRSYTDGRGKVLESTYDPPRSEWEADPDKIVRHTLHLDTPLAPGERMTFTGSETMKLVYETEEGMLYRFHGDYAEDRLVTLKVRLPRNAKIERITPKPNSRFKHDDHQYVMWRRYYQKGESYPLEVVYKLDRP